MGGVLDWSTTPDSNTTVDGVSIAEGMQAGLVNNGMRAIMALVREWQLDASGVVTAGAGNAYTITSNQGIAAYADGLRFSFRADRNNTGAATLNVDGRGAKALRKTAAGALAALAADDLVAEAVYDVVYDVSSDVFVIVGFAGLQASAFMQTVLDDADQSAAQTTLGVKVGTDVQAFDADLTAIAALTGTGIPARTADNTWALRTITSTDGSVTITNPAGVAGDVDLSVSGRKLLATKTASASAALDFTEFNNATYRRYEFELENVKPATDNVSFYFRTSTNAGSTYDAGASDYVHGQSGTSAASATTGASVGASAIPLNTAVTIGNAASEYGLSGELVLTGAPSAAVFTELRGMVTYWNTAGAMVQLELGGARLSAADVDAVRFLFSSGNIESGTIRMYGII